MMHRDGGLVKDWGFAEGRLPENALPFQDFGPGHNSLIIEYV
jgi:hypothetical protein